ncbi:MAG: potassium channel protein [Bacteroidetes bacterium]|nr:MAG: potassium channel protein [Bacteroidota bacterium]
MENKYGAIARYAKLRYAFIMMFSIWIIGTIGYMIIEAANFLDAAFMTVITVSTVGFNDVLILSEEGKIFTMILIAISWVTFAYGISVITSHFVEGEMGVLLHIYRNKKQLNKMKDHVIIVGYGRNGHQAAQELLSSGIPFIVLEQKHDLILQSVKKEIPFLEGDATEDDVLIEAGIERARSIILTLPLDADNLFITISARSLNPNIQIITRATNASTQKKLLIAGANRVVMPEYVGGIHMAALVNSEDVVSFLDKISFRGDAETTLVEIVCSNLPDELRNHSIFELGIRQKTGANIVGFKTPEGEFIINPTPDTVMIPNTKLFVLGTPEQIRKMKDLISI